MELLNLSKFRYKSINRSYDTIDLSITIPGPLSSQPRIASAISWASTLWPLIAHLALSLGLAAFLVYYVDNHDFSTAEARPAYTLAYWNGTKVEYIHDVPLQSYITSAVSAWLVVLRWVAVAWGGALCWRGAFLLMGGPGLPEKELKRMISFGLLFPSPVYKRGLALFIALTLVINLVAQSLSPVLTGSISWVPSPPRQLSRDLVQVSKANVGWRWDGYVSGAGTRQRVYGVAVELATLAWGNGNETDTPKRVLHDTGLNVGSTLNNLTLPHFSVSNFEWGLDAEQLANSTARFDLGQLRNSLGTVRNSSLLDGSGQFAFVPDDGDRWNPLRRVDTTRSGGHLQLPNSTTISETRTLVVIVYPRGVDSETNSPPCSSKKAGLFATGFPQEAKLFDSGGFCCAFARVTYTAGAVECTHCRFSSPFVVQANASAEYIPDSMTNEAWWMMPHIMYHLVQLAGNRIGFSGHLGGSIESHFKEILLRSYSAGWNALHDALYDPTQALTSEFSAVLPTLTARVDKPRLWGWLVAQFLVTLFGSGFAVVLAASRYPLLGDTSMVPFYLDSSELTSGKSESTRPLRVQPQGEQWRIVVD